MSNRAEWSARNGGRMIGAIATAVVMKTNGLKTGTTLVAPYYRRAMIQELIDVPPIDTGGERSPEDWKCVVARR